MKITHIEYSSSYYATTNPPTSKSSSIVFDTLLGNILTITDRYNGDERVKEYRISKEQFGAIKAEFERLNITDLIAAQMKGDIPETPQYMGGMTTEYFSAAVNGCTISTNRMFSEIHALTKTITDFVNEAKLLKDEYKNSDGNRNPDPSSPISPYGGFMGMIGFGMAAEPPKDKVEPPVEEQQEGEWKCEYCGYLHNKTKFCTECGTPKP